VWKIHRYYLKELTISSIVSFIVLFAVMLISLVARGIQNATGGGLLDAAKITLYWTLDAVPHLVTISFLIATVLTFARASQDREITAVRSAGISPRVPMASALLAGITLSVISSFTLHYFIPSAHFHKYRVIADVFRSVVENFGLDSDRITVPGSGVVMTFDRREGRRFHDCTVYLSQDRVGMGNLPWSPVLLVDQIWLVDKDKNSETINIHFQGITDPLTNNYLGELVFGLPLRDITERARRHENDDDLSSDQLLAEVERGVHFAPTGARYNVMRRACFALMPALLAPIGFCIGVLSRDRGRVTALVFALVPLALFYVSDILGTKLLRMTDSEWFAWLPALVLVVLGVPFCWRLLRLRAAFRCSGERPHPR
jgi:lipopolysaccharide export system permease protein